MIFSPVQRASVLASQVSRTENFEVNTGDIILEIAMCSMLKCLKKKFVVDVCSSLCLALCVQSVSPRVRLFLDELGGWRVFRIFAYVCAVSWFVVLATLSPHHKVVLSTLVRWYFRPWDLSVVAIMVSHVNASCLVRPSALTLDW